MSPTGTMPSDNAKIWDLRANATAAPDAPAIVCGDERLTYRELEQSANRFAALFRRLGLQRGAHAACLIGNRPEVLALAWAAWRSGIYLTPIPTALTAGEVRYLVEDCGAACVLVEAAFAATVAGLPGEIDGRIHCLSLRGAIPGFEPLQTSWNDLPTAPQPDEPPGALMLYTSGTTGRPKGVIRPLLPADWRGTPPFAADLIALFGVGGRDVRYLSTAPLYHAAPLRFALAVTAGGGTVHVMERFDAEHALVLVERERITHSQWVPAMFQRLLALPEARRAAFEAPDHRVAIHGAAPCLPTVKTAMIGWWGPILVEYYSGSEGVGLTMLGSAEALRHPGSVGRARKGVLHVVDGAGADLPAGQTGLVCFSGIAPFAYHNAPDKTAAQTLPGCRQTFGDIGHVDAGGYLYLTDRRDDMIISGGVNLYPQEIEAVIRDAPGVWDCAVVGAPDERFGERPVAYVVPHNRAGIADDDLCASVRAHCELNLGRYKHPAAIFVIDALPRSPTGKLLRRELARPNLGTLPPILADRNDR